MALESTALESRPGGTSRVDELRLAQETKAKGEHVLQESRSLQEDSKILLDEIEPADA